MKRYLVLAALLLAITLVAAEAIYIMNSNSPTVNKWLLTRIKELSETDPKRSFPYVEWLAKSNVNFSRKQNKQALALIDNNFELEPSEVNAQFLSAYQEYFSFIDPNAIVTSPDYRASQLFYDLGLFAYQTGLVDLAPKFLETAIYIQPHLSFYYVELANFYLSQGQERNAAEIIDLCLQFDYPREHCKDYQDNPEMQPVGFLEEVINDYYLGLL